jgi:hypothetical protein
MDDPVNTAASAFRVGKGRREYEKIGVMSYIKRNADDENRKENMSSP